MRIKAVRRPNPYIQEGVHQKPKLVGSPYEKTMQRLFSINEGMKSVKPVELKFCKHCSFNIKLSSSGAVYQTEDYPRASLNCKTCSSDICEKCSRVCDRCQVQVCFVCSNTIFEKNETSTICPDCKQ
jgi:hypothetical protein